MLGPLLLIVTGVALVLDGPWGFRDTWVIVGLVGYVGALALGGALQASGTKRVNAMLAERTPDDPEVVASVRRLGAFMWPELGALLIVLLAMTTKPTGGGSLEFWALVVGILVGALLLVAKDLRSAQQPARQIAPAGRPPSAA